MAEVFAGGYLSKIDEHTTVPMTDALAIFHI